MARVLIYDLETSPIVSFNWGTYQQDAIEVKQDWQILCFAYKWEGERKTHVVAQCDFKGYKPGVNDDTNVVRALWELFNESDARVAHNAKKFDEKKSFARFIQRGLEPPAPAVVIDTYLDARRQFGFTSNRLNDLGKYFGVGEKEETGGFETWKGCLAGDMKAWRKMKKYNKQDVVLLEKIYHKLRPWVKNPPKLRILDGRPTACDACGEGPLHQHTKKTLAGQGWRWQYKCFNCGHYQIGTKLFKFEEKL